MSLQRALAFLVVVVLFAACGDIEGQPIYLESLGTGGLGPGGGGSGDGGPSSGGSRDASAPQVIRGSESCPDQPAHGEFCQGPEGPHTCGYGQLRCRCFSRVWSCDGGDIRCPQEPPDTGMYCGGEQYLSCLYPDRLCSCETTSLSWGCAPLPVECPAQRPINGSACPLPLGVFCAYPAWNCFCSDEFWHCQPVSGP